MFANTFTPSNISDCVYDGKIHRQDGLGKKSAWYIAREVNNKKLIIYGDWVTGEQHYYKDGKDFWSIADEAESKKIIKDAENEQLSLQSKQIEFTEKYLSYCQEYFGPVEYIKRKKITYFKGMKSQIEHHDVCLIVPTQDVNGTIWGFQKIFSDGTKLFLFGQRIKGLFFQIGEIRDEVFLCEGLATGTSIYEAIKKTVIVCFNAGNIPNVAEELRIKYPQLKISICADNDKYKKFNAGLEYAKKVPSADLYYPEFKNEETKPTDFNDLHVLEGLEKVRDQIQQIEKMTFDMLPEQLKYFVAQGINSVQCPIEYVAWPAIGALCACLGPKIRGKPSKKGDHNVPCPIWVMGIGEKGTRKSSSLNFGTIYADKIDNELDDDYKEKWSKCREKVELKKAELKAEKKKKDQDVEAILRIENELKDLYPERDYFILQEMTTAALVDTMESAKNGIMIRSDELSHFLQLFQSEHSAALRGFVLSGWNADQKYKKKLKSEEKPTIIKNYSISIVGNIQPSAFEFYFQPSKKTFDDGFLDRFLYYFPETQRPARWKPFAKDIRMMCEAERYFKEAYHMKQKTFEFNEDAEKLFSEIDMQCQELGFSSINTYMKGFWYKAPRNVISIATAFCALDHIDYKEIEEVNVKHVQMAFDLVKLSAKHAQKIFRKIS